jgi:hypothetical protein
MEGPVVDMIRHSELKGLIMLRDTKSSMGLMVGWEESVEQAVKFALANETHITNLNRRVLFSRVWLPQGVAESRMCDCELIAESVMVCHRRTEWVENNASRSTGDMVTLMVTFYHAITL